MDELGSARTWRAWQGCGQRKWLENAAAVFGKAGLIDIWEGFGDGDGRWAVEPWWRCGR